MSEHFCTEVGRVFIRRIVRACDESTSPVMQAAVPVFAAQAHSLAQNAGEKLRAFFIELMKSVEFNTLQEIGFLERNEKRQNL